MRENQKGYVLSGVGNDLLETVYNSSCLCVCACVLRCSCVWMMSDFTFGDSEVRAVLFVRVCALRCL